MLSNATRTRCFPALRAQSSALRACSICSEPLPLLACASASPLTRFSSSLSVSLSSSKFSKSSSFSHFPTFSNSNTTSFPSHTRSYSDAARPNHPSKPPHTGQKELPPKSRHAELYSGTFPAMIPIFLLGSAVYLGLELTQLKLAHEKYMEESEKEVMALEAEIDALQDARVNVQASNSPISPAISPSASPDPASSPTPRSRWRFW